MADSSPEVSSDSAAAQDPSCSTTELYPGNDPESYHQPPETGSNPVDIGDTVIDAKFAAHFCSTVRALMIAQKYELLKNHKKPWKDQAFPTQYLGGCNPSFRHVWLTEHLWMAYSEQVDGAFCIACAFFSAHPSRGKFVTEPFRVWNLEQEE